MTNFESDKMSDQHGMRFKRHNEKIMNTHWNIWKGNMKMTKKINCKYDSVWMCVCKEVNIYESMIVESYFAILTNNQQVARINMLQESNSNSKQHA